jgi:hypothetical protein
MCMARVGLNVSNNNNRYRRFASTARRETFEPRDGSVADT